MFIVISNATENDLRVQWLNVVSKVQLDMSVEVNVNAID